MDTPIVPETRPPSRVNGKRNPAYTRWSRLQNLERERSRERRSHAVHAHKRNKKRQLRKVAHPEKRREDERKRYAVHPEIYRERERRYRARKNGAPIHDLTAAQWADIKAAYGHRCVYCGRKMQALTQDHITPLIKGGSHTRSNVVPACRSCNSKKHTGGVLCPVQPLLLTIS